MIRMFLPAVPPVFWYALLVVAPVLTRLSAQNVDELPKGSSRAVQLDLRGADFRHATMHRVNLADVDLSGSKLRDTDLTGALLWRTRLDGVDFRGVKGLTRQQLSSAVWNHDNPPRLPRELAAFRRFWDDKRMEGRQLRAANWWGADLRGFDFTGADLGGVVLIAANLRGSSLQRANLEGAILAGADLSGVDLRGAKGLTGAQLIAARWDPAKPPVLSDALHVLRRKWEKRQLVRLDLSCARLWLKDLSGANLTGASLKGTVLIGAKLRDARLQDADLSGVVWTGADISGADLRGVKGLGPTTLISARWDPARPPILSAALNVTRKLFEKGRLQTLDLSGANLWSADLSVANFEGSTLRGVTLVDADLRKANLRQAKLAGADLTRADISGADFRNASGFTIGQLLSARWQPDDPPKLSRELTVFRRMRDDRDLRVRPLVGVCLWDVSWPDVRLQGADLTGACFVRAYLRGANFTLTNLAGVEFLGADISGADFRGSRNLTQSMILSAVWDPDNPPTLDRGFDVLRRFIDSRRLNFDLTGAQLHPRDPVGVMGPLRKDAKVTSWRPGQPPRLGMPQLLRLLRQREHARMWITR